MAIPEKLVKLKSETVSGRKVDFYQLKLQRKDGTWRNELVVCDVEGFPPRGGRKHFSGASTKEELMRRLPLMIRNTEEHNRKEAEKQANLKYRFKKKQLFYYKIIKENARYYGGCNVTAEVFKHTPTGLVHLGEVRWCTASYKGEESEVADFLVEKGELRKEHLEDGYYGWRYAEDMNYKIERL